MGHALMWPAFVVLRPGSGHPRPLPGLRSYLSIDHKIGAHPYQPFPTERLRQVVDAVPPEAYPPELRPLCYLEPSHVYKARDREVHVLAPQRIPRRA